MPVVVLVLGWKNGVWVQARTHSGTYNRSLMPCGAGLSNRCDKCALQWRTWLSRNAQLASLREQVKTLELEAERTLLGALGRRWCWHAINEVLGQRGNGLDGWRDRSR